MAHSSHRNVAIETGLHPTVYKALAGCVVWMVAAILLFFGRDSYLALQLAIVAFLCAAVLVLPFCLWAIWHRDHPRERSLSLKEWTSHELQTASGPVEGLDAAIMIMLAPAAVALGLTVISVVAFVNS